MKKEPPAKKPKSKGGQPTKYDPKHDKIAEELCRKKGYRDKDLATHFRVSEATINNWKQRYLGFLESIKRGKYDFDSSVVEQTLLKKATTGIYYTEITKERVKGKDDKENKLVVTKIVRKHHAPSDVAIIFWLKNRQPELWSDMKEIEHRIAETRPPLTEEELAKRLKELNEAGTGLDEKSISGGNG